MQSKLSLQLNHNGVVDQSSGATLSAFGPKPGDPVRIETRIPKGRYSVRLIGIYDQTALIVSAPKGRKVVLTEGVVLSVKLLIGNRLLSFTTRLLKVQAEPFAHWILAYPKQFESQIFRQHTRVPVHLPVLVDRGDMHQPVSALCVDMSLGGASIEAPVVLASVDESVFLTARVSVAGIDQVILTAAKIRSVMQTENNTLGVFRHGVVLQGLEEETRLVLAGYVYQQWLYESGELLDLEQFLKTE